MKIRLTFNLDDEQREAISAEAYEDGKADRALCVFFIRQAVNDAIEEAIVQRELDISWQQIDRIPYVDMGL